MGSDWDDAEPSPLVPARSEQLYVQSRYHPSQAYRSKDIDTLFGPVQSSLAQAVQRPSLSRERDWSPPPPTERGSPSAKQDSQEEEPTAIDPLRSLHVSVWLADMRLADELLQASADIDTVDDHGSTPLMLAIELLPRSREYFGMVEHLLDRQANPRLRSSTGWTPLDAAASTGDKQLVSALLGSMKKTAPSRWDARLSSLARSLQSLPDFECNIRWEFESPVLPWLNKIAPSDVIRLRKSGTNLRIDSTLASWKRFRFSKRRNLTTLFRGDRLKDELCGSIGQMKSSCSGPRLSMLNHSKQTVVDVTEGLDGDESRAVVDDLVRAEIMQWDMQMDSLEVAEATNWLGSAAGPCDINGWKATRFDIRGALGLAVRKKGNRRSEMTFREYFGIALPAQACLPELRAEFESRDPAEKMERQMSTTSALSESSESIGGFDLGQADGFDLADSETVSNASEVLVHWPDSHTVPMAARDNRECVKLQPTPLSQSQGKAASAKNCKLEQDTKKKRDCTKAGSSKQTATGDQSGKATKQVSASVWFASDFPVPLQQFLPILEALAAEHEAIRSLFQVLDSDSLRRAAKRVCEVPTATGVASDALHVFPVRASVPLNLALRATVHFETFTLKPPGSVSSDQFEVPPGYRLVPRREAQKTPHRAKKRMLLANLAV